MSAFEERMKDIASRLSPAAMEVTKLVIEAEHKRRFSEDRGDLPDEFANRALLVMTHKEDDR
ncbi:hypothetical protein V7968_02385 [Nocardia vulneris]|uniref:hypothetical protein n=1 Tax=Nocardia vulneris TaxID=1141657 RepID=UPI0030D5C7B4